MENGTRFKGERNIREPNDDLTHRKEEEAPERKTEGSKEHRRPWNHGPSTRLLLLTSCTRHGLGGRPGRPDGREAHRSFQPGQPRGVHHA
jgi:hypothetical protein